MAGSITVSSITLDSDNNFSIRSNTGATILSANGTGLITGIANGASIVSAQLTTPTISGNTTFDSGTLFVNATNDRVGVGTTNPIAKHHVVGGQSYVTGSASAGAYSRWYNNAQTTDDFQVGQGFASATDNVAVLLNNANAAMVLGTNSTERMRIDSSGRVTTPSQPAFMAHLNTSFTNVSPQTIVFDATQFNTGSNYSTSTGRFTAPVTGLYQFNIVVLVQGGAASMHDFSLQLNGSNYKNGRINAPDSTVNYACAIRLTANDYVSVQVSSTGRQIYGTSDWTYFSGFLVG